MRKTLLFLLVLLMTSCAGAPAPTEAPAPTFEAVAPAETTAELAPQVLPSATPPEPTSTIIAPSPFPSSTPEPELTLTETPLPTLELPTEVQNPPALQAWDGEPTYPGDSKAGYFFRVFYDPETWALTTDNFGSPALGHRNLNYCLIVPAVGHGLPANMNVDHDVRKVGAVEYEVNTAYRDGARQFVTYLGGDANIFTGFEVSFKEEADVCLKDAETVFGTLTSVEGSQATPIP
jgi:hypothetical protein